MGSSANILRGMLSSVFADMCYPVETCDEHCLEKMSQGPRHCLQMPFSFEQVVKAGAIANRPRTSGLLDSRIGRKSVLRNFLT